MSVWPYFEVHDGSTLQSQLGQSLIIFERFPLRLQPELLSVDVLVFRLLPRDAGLQLPDGEGVENVQQGDQRFVGLGMDDLQLNVHVCCLYLPLKLFIRMSGQLLHGLVRVRTILSLEL